MHGSCKCGSIQFTTSKPLQLVNCHCTLCRSINGTAFTFYVVTQLAELSFKSGTDNLSAYAATDKAIKHFCSNCGTPIYNSNATKYPGLAMMYLGALADHAGLQPGMNIYSSSKLDWVDAVSSIRSFDDAPQRA
jgi:hypothetical protein